MRLTKLHGSLDWRANKTIIRRESLPFGPAVGHPGIPTQPLSTVMIYPNPAKDVETLAYPYADLFRDFASAVCRPNSTLALYGYSFGDDHINRVLEDMLTIPSTHLLVIAFNDPGNRLQRFVTKVGRSAQLTLLVGSHYGNLQNLTDFYLPKPAIDLVSIRQAILKSKRGESATPESATGTREAVEAQ